MRCEEEAEKKNYKNRISLDVIQWASEMKISLASCETSQLILLSRTIWHFDYTRPFRTSLAAPYNGFLLHNPQDSNSVVHRFAATFTCTNIKCYSFDIVVSNPSRLTQNMKFVYLLFLAGLRGCCRRTDNVEWEMWKDSQRSYLRGWFNAWI